MNSHTFSSITRSVFSGRTITHTPASAFSGMRQASERSATLSREEFRQAVLEVLG